jgi:hypothetical protein
MIIISENNVKLYINKSKDLILSLDYFVIPFIIDLFYFDNYCYYDMSLKQIKQYLSK